MKFVASLALAFAAARAALTTRSNDTYTKGIHVSDEQPGVDFTAVVGDGNAFVYAKATEGISTVSSAYGNQSSGAMNAGLIHGAYHVARPDQSPGETQAMYFHENGGHWTPDGYTIPGALYFPSDGDTPVCYGLTTSDMEKWIEEYSDAYKTATSRYPVIYTSNEWWTTCTGNNDVLGSTHKLWLDDASNTMGAIPSGWSNASLWQYGSWNSVDGIWSDYYTGDYASLKSYASGH